MSRETILGSITFGPASARAPVAMIGRGPTAVRAKEQRDEMMRALEELFNYAIRCGLAGTKVDMQHDAVKRAQETLARAER